MTTATNGAFTLTSSVSATTPALSTTRNVEIGVLRWHAIAAEMWIEVPIPTEIDHKPFTPGLSAGKVSVHALLTAGGEIRGSLIPNAGVEGPWRLTLERLGNLLAELPIWIDALVPKP